MMATPSFFHPQNHEPLTKTESGYDAPNGDHFPIVNGRPTFVSTALATHMEEERSGIVNLIKTILRRWPRLYVGLIYVISPVCFTGMSASTFLRKFGPEQLVISVGSGVHRYGKNVINIDIFPYAEVDVVASAYEMPFQINSADGMICEYLLEHVPEPERVVAEMFRILKPGGEAYIAIPFVYPFHASPNDFYRWSPEGLKKLCRQFSIVKHGPRSGPTSALAAQCATWLAIVLSFGNESLYQILAPILQVAFFPLKFLDLIIGQWPTSVHGTASCWIICQKPQNT